MNRLAFALVVAAVAGVGGTRPAAAVALVDGNAVTVGGVTFTVTNCVLGAGACASTDVMVADPNGSIGVTIENTAGPLLTTNPGANSPDMTLGLDITSSVGPIYGIDGIITGSSSVPDESYVGAGETLIFPGGVTMPGPSETLATTSDSVAFTGVTSLTVSKDLHDLGQLAHDTTPLALNSISQVVSLTSVPVSSSVPEPQTIAILASALTGLIFGVRRRRR